MFSWTLQVGLVLWSHSPTKSQAGLFLWSLVSVATVIDLVHTCMAWKLGRKVKARWHSKHDWVILRSAMCAIAMIEKLLIVVQFWTIQFIMIQISTFVWHDLKVQSKFWIGALFIDIRPNDTDTIWSQNSLYQCTQPGCVATSLKCTWWCRYGAKWLASGPLPLQCQY